MEKDDKIRGITLRVAIFFGLTTFTLCIAIFYIESILDDTQDALKEKDNLIEVMKSDLESQSELIQDNEDEIHILHEKLSDMKDDMDSEDEKSTK